MNYLTQDYQWLICVIASSLVIVDSDDERTPGNCYSIGSVSILAYGVLDAGYRYLHLVHSCVTGIRKQNNETVRGFVTVFDTEFSR